jgi:hypothetical protein
MLLSDALVGRGADVQHILDEAKTQPHRRTPFARIEENGSLRYAATLPTKPNQADMSLNK